MQKIRKKSAPHLLWANKLRFLAKLLPIVKGEIKIPLLVAKRTAIKENRTFFKKYHDSIPLEDPHLFFWHNAGIPSAIQATGSQWWMKLLLPRHRNQARE